jgi:hypothetical protein
MAAALEEQGRLTAALEEEGRPVPSIMPEATPRPWMETGPPSPRTSTLGSCSSMPAMPSPRLELLHRRRLLARFVLHLLLSLASPPSSPPVSLPFEQPRGCLSGHPHPQPLPLHVMATPCTAMVSVAWSCPTTPLRSFVVLQSRRPRESRGRCRQSPWPCCWTVTANGHKAVFVRLLED